LRADFIILFCNNSYVFEEKVEFLCTEISQAFLMLKIKFISLHKLVIRYNINEYISIEFDEFLRSILVTSLKLTSLKFLMWLGRWRALFHSLSAIYVVQSARKRSFHRAKFRP